MKKCRQKLSIKKTNKTKKDILKILYKSLKIKLT